MGIYIRNGHLAALREYKYAGQDKSLTSKYILNPFWTKMATFFPETMAPNMITLTGFSFVVINFITLLIYTPDLAEPCPPWVYASWGIGLFLYQTFDAIDGKQARKLGLSGPLGECFDHGVDALNTTLEVILFAAATGLGQSWATLLTQFGTLCNFYLTTWEEYHTGVLFLAYFNGPVEGILMIAFFYFVTAFKGVEFWSQSLFDLIGVSPPSFIPKFFATLPLNYHFLVFSVFSLGGNIIQSSLNVIAARRKANLPVLPAMLGLIPFFTMSFVAYLFLIHHEEIVHFHLLPTTLYLGIVFAHNVGTIIIAHVAKKDFPYWNIAFIPMLVGLADVYITPFFRSESYISGEYVLGSVLMAFGLSLGVYGGFVMDCVYTMCDYLDINCLTVKKKTLEHAVQNGEITNVNGKVKTR